MTVYGVMAIIAGRKAGKIAARIGRNKTAVIGLGSIFIANMLLVTLGNFLPVVIIAVGLMDLVL